MIYDLSNIATVQLVDELKTRVGVEIAPCYQLEEAYSVNITNKTNADFELSFKDSGPAVILIVTD